MAEGKRVALCHPFLCPGLSLVVLKIAEALVSHPNSTKVPPRYRINCRGKIVELGPRALLTGILNMTPDSFADGGRYLSPDAALAHAEQMAEAGADIIDIGGESSRPAGPYGAGAEPVSAKEEIRRTVPVIEKVAARLGLPISIDTTKADVARHAIEAGASIVNDISALRFDPKMAETVAEAGVPVVLMHMLGTPKTMQQNPTYGNLIGEIRAFFEERREAACKAGIAPEQIVFDPGLGFGKRYCHNFEILCRLHEFHALNCPLMVGPSRKKFVGPNLPPGERLEGTLAALAFCVAGGAHILRVHDVAAALRAVRVAEQIVHGATEAG